MDYLVFLGLLFGSVMVTWVLQAFTFVGASRLFAGPDNGPRKAFRAWLLFFSINLAFSLCWGVLSLASNAPGWIGLPGSIITLIIGLAVVQRAYRISLGRAAVILALPLAIGFIGAFTVRAYVGQAFTIPTSGMAPALQMGDHLFAAKYAYRQNEPERGDIVVFRYPAMESLTYVKRVVGLPGETIAIRSQVVYIDGEPLDDPWANLKDQGRTNHPKLDREPFFIPEGEYFMLGDNRYNSQDSRFWGTLPRANIVGKVMVLYWPLQRIGSP